MKILIILSFIVSLKTCCETKRLTIQENNVTNLMDINGTYQVNMLNDNDIASKKLTLTFDQKENILSGFSGCNRFSGKYTLENGLIKIGPLASTRMFCQEAANQLESEFLELLSKIDEVNIENKLLKFTSNKKQLITATKVVENKLTTLSYSANSRGHLIEITINDSVATILKDKKSKTITKKVENQEWDKFMLLLKDVDLDQISNLKAPTEARFHDGAAIGKLKIKVDDATYESSSFDHGKPPYEIEVLVKEILSLSENIE